MVKILHAADFHLDSPFAGLTSEQARARRREGRENIARLANYANAGHVDLVLLAGDLFDSGEIYRQTAETLAKALGTVEGRVFIAPGNHDYWDEKGPYAQVNWPENVHIFKSDALEAVELPELNCVVHGAAFTAPECTDNLFGGFRAEEDGRIHIMVLHGDLDGNAHRYNSFSKAEVAESGLDYLALGHVHAFSGINRLWRTTWAYPGCPEGRGFDECGRRGILVGTVDKGEADVHFVSFARRKYEIRTVDVTGREALEALETQLPPGGTAADLYRVVFTGETAAGVDLEAVRAVAAERFYHLELRDETRLTRDLWQRAGEESLTGLFLRGLLRRREAAADEAERLRIDRAARIGLAALEKREL